MYLKASLTLYLYLYVIPAFSGPLITGEEENWCEPGTPNCPYTCQWFNMDRICHIKNFTNDVLRIPDIRVRDGGAVTVLKFTDSRFTALSHCGVEYCSKDKFPNLEQLDASKIGLTRLGFNFFEKYPKLKVIDLSFNNFDSFGVSKLKGADQVERLNLQNNQLKLLLYASSFGQLLPNLKWLNLRENRIVTFDFVALIRGCPMLRIVDLEQNRLSCEKTVSGNETLKAELVEIFTKKKGLIFPEIKDDVGCESAEVSTEFLDNMDSEEFAAWHGATPAE